MRPLIFHPIGHPPAHPEMGTPGCTRYNAYCTLHTAPPALSLGGTAVYALLANGASGSTPVRCEAGLGVARALAGEVTMHHTRHSHRRCVGVVVLCVPPWAVGPAKINGGTGLRYLGSSVRMMDLDFYYRLQIITDNTIPDLVYFCLC